MASVENIPPVNNESEMEEGEIVDDIDDLSDISSEEEFLLRQRLQVLENYNNVLERKKAKRASILSGKNYHSMEMQCHDLSEISATELEENIERDNFKCRKVQSFKKISHKYKNINIYNNHGKNKEHKKKTHHKRKLEVKVISESSEESDDEYRNKRRKLANAVSLNKVKSDTSTLKARLENMMRKSIKEDCLDDVKKELNREGNKEISNCVKNVEDNNSVESIQENNEEEVTDVGLKDQLLKQYNTVGIENGKQDKEVQVSYELIDLCSEDNSNLELIEKDVVDSSNKENCQEQGITNKSNKEDSDDDLELLRQHALKTKNVKPKLDKLKESIVEKSKQVSDEDDSDTSELRLICLKSALLKKAIEMKLKQKLRKRLKSKTLQDDFSLEQEALKNISDIDNNTDIESVDMDIGSDIDEKGKESNANLGINSEQKSMINTNSITSNIANSNVDDELEEDEDLLRAKLLTSLSKNLPNLVKMEILNTIDNDKSSSDSTNKPKQIVSEEKKFIINLQDSDSEAEHEATKNLTKMHMKLSEHVDFQQKLDLFLKSTRMQVENTTKLPDVVQQPIVPKTPVKYVAKAVNHLPKSEQIEYKNLVRRMAELEKIKQARQISMNVQNNSPVLKDTLKPRNVTVNTKNSFSTIDLEEKIAISRKNIAEESAKMMKLREEATKLSQKYKIAATELRNISTAISLNKKDQRTVQNKLSKIRVQHQMLLKSSNFKHSTGAPPSIIQTYNKAVVSRLQKENHPTKADHRIPTMLKAVTVSVVNNLSKENAEPSSNISVEVDVGSNKKIVKIPKSPDKGRTVHIIDERLDTNAGNGVVPCKELAICDNKDTDNSVELKDESLVGCENKDINDYQSPLQAFGKTTWEEDPNAVLCPYEVGGSCRDPGCKFLHPKVPKRQ